MIRRVVILGATGSIGSSALDVIGAHPNDFKLVGLSAHTNLNQLLVIAERFPEAALAISKASPAGYEPSIDYYGPDAEIQLLENCRADLIINGISGSAGLKSSIKALETGDLALANKETIVMAGAYIQSLAKRYGRALIPVDSEHSGVFSLIQAHGRDNLEEVYLTASGGPFRQFSLEALSRVTINDALAHPTWQMGVKITIDSASLANKGLEVIEAVNLFNLEPTKVKVVVHPQSKVHALIRLIDGSIYAQLSQPDMRLPIHTALFYPNLKANSFGRLDINDCVLSFEKPDTERFPMLKIAYYAALNKGLYPVAFNAANEIAVEGFCNNHLRFLDIATVTQAVLDHDWLGDEIDLESIFNADKQARLLAGELIKELSKC